MADDDFVEMKTTIAGEQNGDWKSKLNDYIEDRRPPEMVLSGSPAADLIQPALDQFVKDVDVMFDDNRDLGLLLHTAMVGQRELIVEANKANKVDKT